MSDIDYARITLGVRGSYALHSERRQDLRDRRDHPILADEAADLTIMRRLECDRMTGMTMWHDKYGLTL